MIIGVVVFGSVSSAGGQVDDGTKPPPPPDEDDEDEAIDALTKSAATLSEGARKYLLFFGFSDPTLTAAMTKSDDEKKAKKDKRKGGKDGNGKPGNGKSSSDGNGQDMKSR